MHSLMRRKKVKERKEQLIAVLKRFMKLLISSVISAAVHWYSNSHFLPEKKQIMLQKEYF